MNPPNPKHIVIVAGEESGDWHAANMVRALLLENPHLKITGIGGEHMRKAGVLLISDLAQFGVTGFSEVFKHLFIIKKAFSAIKIHLRQSKPNLLILVDYPGFNLRLAKFAKLQLGLRTLYYISPQIWAWKAKRIKTIKRCIDTMAVILPFEKAIYEKAGVPVSFVGHPLVQTIPDSDTDTMTNLRLQLKLPTDKKLLAILPGSRRNEVANHMPVLVETVKKLAEQIENLHFVIPIAETLEEKTIASYFDFTKGSSCSASPLSPSAISFIRGQAVQVIGASDAVVVASGTASLECAMSLKPMCIIYKAAHLTYIIATQVIRVKYLGLCNLLQNKMIVPELLQADCNAEELTKTIAALLNDERWASQMKDRLEKMKRSLSLEEADCSLVEVVMNELSGASNKDRTHNNFPF